MEQLPAVLCNRIFFIIWLIKPCIRNVQKCKGSNNVSIILIISWRKFNNFKIVGLKYLQYPLLFFMELEEEKWISPVTRGGRLLKTQLFLPYSCFCPLQHLLHISVNVCMHTHTYAEIHFFHIDSDQKHLLKQKTRPYSHSFWLKRQGKYLIICISNEILMLLVWIPHSEFHCLGCWFIRFIPDKQGKLVALSEHVHDFGLQVHLYLYAQPQQEKAPDAFTSLTDPVWSHFFQLILTSMSTHVPNLLKPGT